MSRINLLEETKQALELNGKSLCDIEWFGTRDTQIVFDVNKLLDVCYNNGFGGCEIPENFIIVGRDFWLERNEYDGSEWWEYKELPKKPENVVYFKSNLLDWELK